MQGRWWLALSGVLGALAVGLGAFHAHGVESVLQSAQLGSDVVADRLNTFDIGVRYHFYHALGLAAVGVLSMQYRSWLLTLSGLLMFVGTLMFSGVLYYIGVTGEDTFSRIAPFGGISQIAGWFVLACSAPFLKKRDSDA